METYQKDYLTTTFQTCSSSDLNFLQHQNTYIVTSNQRLSRFRLKSYEIEQAKQGKRAWNTPNILPWSAWLQQQWQRFGDGVWLSKQQETLLWRNCIIEDENTEVLNPKALSKQAIDAWNILADYHIDPSCLQHAGEEHAALWRWGKSASTHTKHYLQHQVLPTLTKNMKKTSGRHDTYTIILDGFDTFSPAQQHYFNHLQTLGYQIFEMSNDTKEAEAAISVYQDEETELRQVCQSIRRYIDQYPKHQIGVIVPDLEQRAAHITRVFTEELVPKLSLEAQPDLQGEFFNISIGAVLAKQPMIQAAFLLLDLIIKPQIQHHETTQLLLNPYITGYSEESNQRAALDAQLRARNQYQITMQQLLLACQQQSSTLPFFQQVLASTLTYNTQGMFRGKQLLSHWVQLVEQCLTQHQWHEQACSPHELAQVQNWRDLMHQLTSLDDFCGVISWQEALSRLKEYAYEQPFRPAPGQAHIQIMGLLEAANLRFDHAFILGMDDNTWPTAAKPNPLIPFDIQVLHQTPHANSEREWLYAQTIWQHTQYITPTLAISYAKNKDGQEVQVSPLLKASIKTTEGKEYLSTHYISTLQQYPATTQNIHENLLTVAQNENISGGTGILKAQAACAFQAFARYRLHLNKLETPSLGLSSSEQGTLLHAALEDFWIKAKTHATLLTWIDSEQLEIEIQNSIRHAWSSLNRPITHHTKLLEEQRLLLLLNGWLKFESQRKPFSVKNTEVWRDLSLGAQTRLKLHTKLDRIDEDEQKHHIIIDYKTGENNARSKALGERPDEPQIPLYYLAEKALKHDVNALVTAQVRSGKLKFEGFAQETDILPSLKAYKPSKKEQPKDWQELTALWQETLNHLADAFMAGETSVLPKGNQSCTYCEFEGICQIKNTSTNGHNQSSEV